MQLNTCLKRLKAGLSIFLNFYALDESREWVFFNRLGFLLLLLFFSWCLAQTVFKTWRTIPNVTALFSSFKILCLTRWSLPLCPFHRAGRLLRVDQKVVWAWSSFLPVELALHFGWGMVRALAALHRAGFVHRLVSPHSFSYITPPTMDNIVNRLLITDLSLAMPWPKKLVVLIHPSSISFQAKKQSSVCRHNAL